MKDFQKQKGKEQGRCNNQESGLVIENHIFSGHDRDLSGRLSNSADQAIPE